MPLQGGAELVGSGERERRAVSGATLSARPRVRQSPFGGIQVYAPPDAGLRAGVEMRLDMVTVAASPRVLTAR
ncbi:hypothetical protein Xph01_35500 [Micromonospora phaseoli]|nr:hypothetical protein Xph01_35500 [Micromonospora phaseoli]